MLHKEEKRALGQMSIILLIVLIGWAIVPSNIIPEPTPIAALLAPNSLGVLLALGLGTLAKLVLSFAFGIAVLIMIVHSLKNTIWPLWKSGLKEIGQLTKKEIK